MKGRAFLFLEAGRRVYRCQFTKDLTLIGSDADCDIVIRDKSVEGHHAQITRAGEVYTLRPLDDSDVRIDGQAVDAAYELMNGNKIGIGDTDILFAREQHEAPTTIHLVIRKPGDIAMGFWTSKSTIVIGREKGDIIIDDALLSKVHAIIENFCPNGQFLLDAHSERGTGLNGESIEARSRLLDGDTITVGGVEIEFKTTPVESREGKSAAAIAAERIAAVRRAGVNAATEAPQPMRLRNPYQRYPSKLPDPTPSPDPERSQDEPRGAPPRRARGLDLKSGLQTGIVSLNQGGRAAAPERPRPSPQRAPSSPLPSASAPRRPEPTVRPEELPRFAPRPHWGGSDKEKDKGFGSRRFEMDTRLSRGNADQSGLWYLPKGADGQAGAPPPTAPPQKPIIRPRGDKAPEPPPPQPSRQAAPERDRDMDDGMPKRAMIRRPAPGSAEVRPMAPRDLAAPVRVQEPRRYTPPPSIPPSARPAPQVAADVGPGARPDDQDRWYIPPERQKAVRQVAKPGDQPYYLPEQKGGRRRPSGEDYADEYGDRHERPEREKTKGGNTRSFNPDDR